MVGFKFTSKAAASAALLLAIGSTFTAAQSITTEITVNGSPTTTVVAPSPTGRGFCEFYIDHWDCDPSRPEATATPTETQAAPSIEPSPLDDDHDHSGHSHGGHSHAGHNHAGHSHGPDEIYGCGLAPLENYDKPLHIGALFILLASSALGAYLPILIHSRRSTTSQKTNGWADEVFFICRHFGTGVLISTAFVHLLSHAIMYWSNECVGELKYEATGTAIAMGAVWLAEEVGAYGGLTFAQAKVAEWDVVAIEAGIIFHSILIGVTLGVATGSGFVALLMAITFHQLFEGLALGSRLSLLIWKRTTYKLTMATAFVLTTPLGVAIGIGVRKRFNGNNAATLITLGTFHSLSAGILLYTALVELLSGDFIHNRQMQGSSLGRCVAAVVALTVGIIAMSVLALWA
ncbi:hypothetical protein [Sporisorium scitamineum]|uniref:ZRT2-Zinc transporter II n=1 Tax=Sporisorium scitamineum TaxID=49012 RepID=A0A0F7RX12_9BASI|nr:hypothetical protein [Sporisorium scitamineum]